MAMELVLVSSLIFAVASFFTYILPMMVAFHRRHESYTVIFLMNLLMGWTGFVWLVCLIWAVVGSGKRNDAVRAGSSDLSKCEELERTSDLTRRGGLTADEFKREQAKL